MIGVVTVGGVLRRGKQKEATIIRFWRTRKCPPEGVVITNSFLCFYFYTFAYTGWCWEPVIPPLSSWLKTWLLDQKTIETEFPPFQSHPQYLFFYLNTSIYELRKNNEFDTLRMLPVFSWFAGSNLANDICQNHGVFGILHTLVLAWSNGYILMWRWKMKGAPENTYFFQDIPKATG